MNGNAFKIYSWRGEPIRDIEQWTADRGEKMIDIIWLVKSVNPHAKSAKYMITYTEEEDTMPESFFKALLIPPNHILKSHKSRLPKLSSWENTARGEQ